MHSPINNLIKMFFQYGVYMLANLSLAILAQYIKHKLLYDDYRPTFPIKCSNIPIFPHPKKTLEEEEEKNIDIDDFFDEEKNQITKKLKKSLIFTPKTPFLASSTMKISNIDYMKNIALKNKIDENNLNKIIKENNKEEEEDDEYDDNEIEENEEDNKTWIKVKEKLSKEVFSSDILKEFPSFYENYKDKILTYHLKYITK
jgi:hypothetical protein